MGRNENLLGVANRRRVKRRRHEPYHEFKEIKLSSPAHIKRVRACQRSVTIASVTLCIMLTVGLIVILSFPKRSSEWRHAIWNGVGNHIDNWHGPLP